MSHYPITDQLDAQDDYTPFVAEVTVVDGARKVDLARPKWSNIAIVLGFAAFWSEVAVIVFR